MGALEDLWQVRDQAEPNWVDLVNELQMLLGIGEAGELDAAKAQAICDVVRVLGDLDVSDERYHWALDRLDRAGFDTAMGLSFAADEG